MTSAKRFENPEVRQTLKELTNLICSYSSAGAFSHDHGPSDQMRRATVSEMSNFPEGFESQTQALFIQFPGRSKGPAGELRVQFYTARDQGYLTDEQFAPAFLCAETCSKQPVRFIQSLETRLNSRRVREDGVSYNV